MAPVLLNYLVGDSRIVILKIRVGCGCEAVAECRGPPTRGQRSPTPVDKCVAGGLKGGIRGSEPRAGRGPRESVERRRGERLFGV